jgi:hypothetical protein
MEGVQRRKPKNVLMEGGGIEIPDVDLSGVKESYVQEVSVSWRRIMLLIVAVTIHNIPGMIIDYRCDDGRFSLSVYHCQVLTPTFRIQY